MRLPAVAAEQRQRWRCVQRGRRCRNHGSGGAMLITIEGWDREDRRPVRGSLTGIDRAQTQAAELVSIQLDAAAGATPVVLKQNPTHALRDHAPRVGAVAWDSAYILSSYLDTQPAGSFKELRAVELGAGACAVVHSPVMVVCTRTPCLPSLLCHLIPYHSVPSRSSTPHHTSHKLMPAKFTASPTALSQEWAYLAWCWQSWAQLCI